MPRLPAPSRIALWVMIKTEDLADLSPQSRDGIAVALLTEAAEAVEILPDLRRGRAHDLRQFG